MGKMNEQHSGTRGTIEVVFREILKSVLSFDSTWGCKPWYIVSHVCQMPAGCRSREGNQFSLPALTFLHDEPGCFFYCFFLETILKCRRQYSKDRSKPKMSCRLGDLQDAKLKCVCLHVCMISKITVKGWEGDDKPIQWNPLFTPL